MEFLCVPHHVIENDNPVERIAFNPTNDSILAITANNSLVLYDLMSQRKIKGLYSDSCAWIFFVLLLKRTQITLECDQIPETLQAISWSRDGKKIAISSRDTVLRIFDVGTGCIEMAAQGHCSIRDSRVLFVKREYLATTGVFFYLCSPIRREVLCLKVL